MQPIFLSLLLLFCSNAFGQGHQAGFLPTLPQKVDAGHLHLKWGVVDGVEGKSFRVEQSLSKNFDQPTLIYEGPDQATFLSGLKNSRYFFRVKETDGQWSDIYTVEVEHFSTQFALILFVIGFLTFGGIAGVIWHGNRRMIATEA